MSQARISVTAEVVGTGSDGTEPSLLFSVQRHGIYSDDVTLLQRYLFNCGEGTGRLCGENGIKMSSLDAIYCTRLDVHSVSGVPGMVFGLSTCGAATLRLHGPVGMQQFLFAMQSFVRRKYPQIQCVEVMKSDYRNQKQPEIRTSLNSKQDSMEYETWESDEERSDRHFRIFPILFNGQENLDKHENPCFFCTKSRQDEAKAASCSVTEKLVEDKHSKEKASDATASYSFGRRRCEESDEHEQCRTWLLKFYKAKAPERIDYVDVILNRYRGRYDDLKMQLSKKYGDISEESSEDEFNSDDEEVQEERTDDLKNGEDFLFTAEQINRSWLEKFYRLYHPEKLAHIDKVLRQFSGREETLKQMLLRKYAAAINESGDSREQKKRKLIHKNENPLDAEKAPTNVEIAKVCIKHQSKVPPSSRVLLPIETSLCYVLQFQYAPFPVVWIIDCRSLHHVPQLLGTFPAPTDSGCDIHQPTLVVHFTPSHVLQSPDYLQWMRSFAPSSSSSAVITHHLIFDGDALQSVEHGVFSFSFLTSARREATNSHHGLAETVEEEDRSSQPVSDLRQNLSEFLTKTRHSLPSERQRQITQHLRNSYDGHIAQSKLRFNLLDSALVNARIGFDYSKSGWIKDEKESQYEEGSEKDEITAYSAKSSHTKPIQRRRLIILGTGSAAPSKLRASSGIYLELTASTESTTNSLVDSMLLDCGEGTYGQLWRQFGNDTLRRIGGLRCIWISHHHADHHGGLVRILDEFVRFHSESQASKGELIVIASQSVLSYVASWIPQIDPGKGGDSFIQLVTCRDFNQRTNPLRLRLLSQIRNVITSIWSVPVWHCHDAYGLVLTLVNGKKVVYSGDTKPCNQLVQAGMNAALLIHEATFDDSMEDDADMKKHSTVGQAIDISRRMHAQEIILTHFSQRYPSLPPTTTTDANFNADQQAKVHCAYDGFTYPLPF